MCRREIGWNLRGECLWNWWGGEGNLFDVKMNVI